MTAGPLEPTNSMKQVLIIGSGQLGSRHLQGLPRSEPALSIHLLDPSTESLARRASGGRDRQLATPQPVHRSRRSGPTPLIDLAISATTSDHRLASLKTVFATTRIDALVLEKVLFRSLAEYADAENLLAKHDVRTWVDCARRRMFPGLSSAQGLLRRRHAAAPARRRRRVGASAATASISLTCLPSSPGRRPSSFPRLNSTPSYTPASVRVTPRYSGALAGRARIPAVVAAVHRMVAANAT